MSRNILLIAAMIALLASSSLSLLAQTSGPDKWRTWKSKDGKDAIEASYVSYDRRSRIVSLLDRNGNQIHVNIAQLGRADRKYISTVAKPGNSFGKSSIFAPSIAAETDRANVEAELPKSESASRETGRRQRLYGINWIPGVENALAIARSEKEKRPVMWFRVLGELDGFM